MIGLFKVTELSSHAACRSYRHMKKTIVLAALMCLPLTCLAEKGQSIMFGDTDPIYSEKQKDTSAEDQAALCKKLRAQMDELKGKPQRRNAVVQRYRLECQQQ